MTCLFTRRSAAVLLSLVLGGIAAAPQGRAEALVRIGSNSGGRIGDFMGRLVSYRQNGTQVQFTGSCDSACTLLLALPRNQSCVSNGAVFRFHAPTGGSAATSAAARAYMMGKYPGWVRSWISSHHGLTRQLISMDYAYASRFMRNCDEVASR
ncbi:MAG: hypothetical protein U1E15_00215 [Hyphomicrobiales bacterium]